MHSGLLVGNSEVIQKRTSRKLSGFVPGKSAYRELEALLAITANANGMRGQEYSIYKSCSSLPENLSTIRFVSI